MLRHDPELQARYVDTGEAIPDALRRPISVNAVAQSLRLPFETVRRKVRVLMSKGLCVATASGVYVPREAIVSEAHASIQAARMARLGRLREDLVAVGFLSPEDAPPLSATLSRSVNRALSEYMLRACDRAIDLTGGVADGFVLAGLCLACAGLGEAASNQTPSVRTASMRSVALRLGMPHETVRRRLLALETAGLARRRGRRWIPVAPKSRRAWIMGVVEDNELDLRRLFLRLRELAEAARV
jgi:hypothetical protein